MKGSTVSTFSAACSEDRLYCIFFWIVVTGSMLVFFWDIWSIPLLTHNEGRRLVVLREMIANSSWIIPTMNGEVYLEKPPLFYWFGAIFGLLAKSTSEWVLRLPSALSAMCLVWMLFFCLKEYIGRWAALFGVLILITSSFFTMQARLAELEMLLTFCVFSSLLCYFEYIQHGSRYHLYGAYLLMALAFLTKGPVAFLFFLPPIMCYGLLAHSKHALKGLIDWRGWLLFSVIAFPWFLYINTQFHGAQFRVLSNEISYWETKREPFYFYLHSAATAFLPWILLLLWQPRGQFKKLLANEAGRFFGLAALVPLIIFSFFIFKRDKYILPMYPALAVWLGIALGSGLDQVKRRWPSATVALTVCSSLLIAGFVGYYTTMQAHVMYYRYAAFPPLAARLDSLRKNSPVYFLSEESIQLVYYYGRPIPVLQKDDLGKVLADGRPFLLLVRDKYIKNAKFPGLCQLERIEHFGDTNKKLYILAGGSLCRSSVSKVPALAER